MDSGTLLATVLQELGLGHILQGPKQPTRFARAQAPAPSPSQFPVNPDTTPVQALMRALLMGQSYENARRQSPMIVPPTQSPGLLGIGQNLGMFPQAPPANRWAPGGTRANLGPGRGRIHAIDPSEADQLRFLLGLPAPPLPISEPTGPMRFQPGHRPFTPGEIERFNQEEDTDRG